jgi:hypothetical protein
MIWKARTRFISFSFKKEKKSTTGALPLSVLKFDRNKKIDPSDPFEFRKIWYNSIEFRLEEVLYSKNPKNQKSAEFTD